MSSFAEVFGRAPTVTAEAPGRVNVLGEHTDYNDGFVLPIAIPQRTHVALRPASGEVFTVHADSLDRRVTFKRGELPRDQFARYVFGCIRVLELRGEQVPALDVHIRSDVPIGVGLSSSAALEIAMLRALRTLLGLSLDDVMLARLGQQAEIEFAGVRCGIMDQMAASLADEEHMLFLDTRTLARTVLPLPAYSAILVLDSGIARSLATSKYNERRAECDEAARRLGVPALRDVERSVSLEALPDPYRRRARHVISENARVLAARDSLDANELGRLMNASHASLRDDFEVSVPPLDALVALLEAHPLVYGARLTGAGFGGACVSLCHAGRARQVAADVLRDYARLGERGRLLVPAPAPGAARQ